MKKYVIKSGHSSHKQKEKEDKLFRIFPVLLSFIWKAIFMAAAYTKMTALLKFGGELWRKDSHGEHLT